MKNNLGNSNNCPEFVKTGMKSQIVAPESKIRRNMANFANPIPTIRTHKAYQESQEQVEGAIFGSARKSADS